jgi:predicted transcriptional regulator
MVNQVTVAFLMKNAVKADEVAELMKSVHAMLIALAAIDPPPKLTPPSPYPIKPSVPVSNSVHPDSVTCLECGRRFKSLSFHLRKHGLSQVNYRAKWTLPADYPMVAPDLKARRSALAIEQHFGHYRQRRHHALAPTN